MGELTRENPNPLWGPFVSLSADPRHSVMLVEAGTDYTAGQTPEDILDTYAGRALGNRSYFWDLQVRRGADVPPARTQPAQRRDPRCR